MGMAIGEKAKIWRDLENVSSSVLRSHLDFDSNKLILKHTFKVSWGLKKWLGR